ncbi:MAG: hypothetical protein ACFFDT_28385 [Candidatus Hodarchaeota archaeon]
MECPKCHFENPEDTLRCSEYATPLPSKEGIPVTETLETSTEKSTRGTTFAGRYGFIEELGKGNMGKVYQAVDEKLFQYTGLTVIKFDAKKKFLFL